MRHGMREIGALAVGHVPEKHGHRHRAHLIVGDDSLRVTAHEKLDFSP
jgi:hypothetical protein